MQPRHQVNVVGDPTRQLLRRVHVRVHQSYPAAAEARKTKSTKIRLQFRWGGKNPIQSGGGPRPPTWEDDAAAEVEGLRGAREGGDDVGGGAHGGDTVAGDGDGAVSEDAELAVHGDDDRVAKDGVDRRRVGGHLRGWLSSARAGAGTRASVRRSGGGFCFVAAGGVEVESSEVDRVSLGKRWESVGYLTFA